MNYYLLIIPAVVIGIILFNLILLCIRLYLNYKRSIYYDRMYRGEEWNRWMAYIKDKNTKIKELIVPSSHDAGAYTLNYD